MLKAIQRLQTIRMIRSRFWTGVLGLLIHLVFNEPSCIAEPQPRSGSRPNVVFILIDDLRYDTFSFMHHPFIKTPRIDELAESGCHFQNAFVTTSLCSPSRASFLTGQFMHSHRVVDNSQSMPEGTMTFPQLFQRAGYTTAFIGKWHMGGSSDAARPGFDHWISFRGQGTYGFRGQSLNVNGRQVPRTDYMTDELSRHALEWLQQQSAEQPFLMYLSHKGVHGLYEPAVRHLNRYRDAPWPLPKTWDPPANPDSRVPLWVLDQRNSWHGVEFPYHGRSGQSVPEMYRHYCEMILSIDDSVGAILDQLHKQSLDRRTVIVFTSDGGHLWGEHGLIDKRCAYEESMRIPLLVRIPGLTKPGQVSDALVANIDIAPSLLDLAGLPIPQTMDGRNFVPLLRHPAHVKATREALLYEYFWEPAFPQTPTTFALRTQRFKLIQYHGIWDTDELYDIKQDPLERVNLINNADQQARVDAMRRDLHESLRATDGLMIPLGFKRGHGKTLRNRSGSKRSPFPDRLLSPPPTRIDGVR